MFLAIPYAIVMLVLIRPLLRRLSAAYSKAGRLTPNVLATALAGLLLSSYATNWMGLHFIFGAFLFGFIMPRDAVLRLREDILERLEQVSVIVLLPIYFVVSGLSINLSTVGSAGLVDLAAILVVAIVGKLVGAYVGAQIVGIRGRNASVMATLMNTRGLTEIVILGVGLQLHIITKPLYALMVVMALVTTAMSGPLLRVLYPERVMEHDIATADRAQLAGGPAHRILVLVDRPESAGPLVDVGAELAARRPGSELVLAHLVSLHGEHRMQVGTGLGGELVQMTVVMGQLRGLADRASSRGIQALVLSRFSDDVPGELPGYLAAAEPDTVILGSDGEAHGDLRLEDTTRLITERTPPPQAPERDSRPHRARPELGGGRGRRRAAGRGQGAGAGADRNRRPAGPIRSGGAEPQGPRGQRRPTARRRPDSRGRGRRGRAHRRCPPDRAGGQQRGTRRGR